MKSTTVPGLASLIAPFPVERFLSDHWPETPLHVPGPVERLREALGVPELRDFRTFERAWPYNALVLSKRGGDESSGISIDGPAIRRVFDAGLPMFLHRPDRAFPALREWIDALRNDLGFPANGQLLCSTHASPGGTTTAMHFDDALSFVLQLSGTKTWHVAPNRSIPRPTGRYSIAMPGLDGALAACLVEPLPRELPRDAISITLQPGSVLFLPSGWWHAVDGVDESLALMFIGLNWNWADVVSRVVRRTLAKDLAWRKLAIGAGSENAAYREKARAEVSALLAVLPELLAQISVDDLLTRRYVRSALTSCELANGVATFESDSALSRVELDSEQQRVLDAVLASGGVVTAQDLVDRGHGPAVVDAVLRALVSVGYMRVD